MHNVDVKYSRMLKCGQIAGIKLNKVSLLKDKQWGLLSLHSKQQMSKCDCTENSVHDIQHLVYECVARGHPWIYELAHVPVVNLERPQIGLSRQHLMLRMQCQWS